MPKISPNANARMFVNPTSQQQRLQYCRSSIVPTDDNYFSPPVQARPYRQTHAIKRPAFAGLFGSSCEKRNAWAKPLVLRDHRAAPAEPVVQAGLDGVLVVAEARPDDVGRSRGERGVAEVIVLILD